MAQSIQVGEKIYRDYRLIATSSGGHSSQPERQNAVYAISDAMLKICEHEFLAEFNDTTRVLFASAAATRKDEMGAALVVLPTLGLLAGDPPTPTRFSDHLAHLPMISVRPDAIDAAAYRPTGIRAGPWTWMPWWCARAGRTASSLPHAGAGQGHGRASGHPSSSTTLSSRYDRTWSPLSK